MRSRALIAAACAVGCVAVGLTVPTAQQAAAAGQDRGDGQASTPLAGQRPAFRGGTTAVYVDAYPRRDGRIVEGLKAADFEVREDGKPQQVDLVEFIAAPPADPTAELHEPVSQADADAQAAGARNRVFVVYLDIYHTTRAGSFAAAAPLKEFLTRWLSPTDLFALTTPESSASTLAFGRLTGPAVSELTVHSDWGIADEKSLRLRNDLEARLYGCSGSNQLVRLAREDALYVSLEKVTARLGSLKDQRKHVIYASEGYIPQRPLRLVGRAEPGGGARLDFQQIGRPPAIPGLPGAAGGRTSPLTSEQLWCDTQTRRLFAMDFAARHLTLLASAKAANVAFYPIDVGGLAAAEGCTATGTQCQPRPFDAAGVGTLQTLAEETGGIAVVNTNDLTGRLDDIVESLRAYYLLSYYPSNQTADGRYRRIDVKVRGPGVSVSARNGYFAISPKVAAAAAAASRDWREPSTEVAAVQRALARLARIRPEAELFTYAAWTGDAVAVVAELGGRDVERGRWKTGARVTVTVTSPGAAETTVTGRLHAGSRSVRVDVSLGAGAADPWIAKVAVDGDAGHLEDRIEIAPRSSATGDPLVFRAAAFMRAPLAPAADFRFRRSERIRVEWPGVAADMNAQVRVLDRNGTPLALTVPVTTRPDAPAVAELPMTGFAEGDYVLELTSGRAAGERTLIAFRVAR